MVEPKLWCSYCPSLYRVPQGHRISFLSGGVQTREETTIGMLVSYELPFTHLFFPGVSWLTHRRKLKYVTSDMMILDTLYYFDAVLIRIDHDDGHEN